MRSNAMQQTSKSLDSFKFEDKHYSNTHIENVSNSFPSKRLITKWSCRSELRRKLRGKGLVRFGSAHAWTDEFDRPKVGRISPRVENPRSKSVGEKANLHKHPASNDRYCVLAAEFDARVEKRPSKWRGKEGAVEVFRNGTGGNEGRLEWVSIGPRILP